MRDHDASSVVVAGRTAGGLAAALQGQLARLRLGATKWGASDEVRPDDGPAQDALAQASALWRADRWAGWGWEHPTDLSVAAGVVLRGIAIPVVTEEASPAFGWERQLPLLHQHARSELAELPPRFSTEYPGYSQAKSVLAFDAPSMVRAREFEFAPRREEQRGRD